jgi:hypothetical protein
VQQKIADAQRDAAIANTTLKTVVYGMGEKFARNQLPAAAMTYTGGTPFEYAVQKSDMIMHQVWFVQGRDPDEISLILEQLMFLWYKTSVRSTLSALGFVGFELGDMVPAQLIQGGDLSGALMGVIEFDVRMTISNPF